ncbi:MAG: glycoside hydrolase family 2 [Tannerella sp.]|jgi:hypothetical protein|nr:glycoside hydrolase family 2 [Tannerella sp.]
MKNLISIIIFCFCSVSLFAQDGRTTISLNGQWDFEQTKTAFPPAKFTRKIPVPGLIHLATPRIEEYDTFFQRPAAVKASAQHNFLDRDYTPKYSWYKRKVKIDKNLEGKQLSLTLKKSQFVTMVYVNGMFVGRSIECFTPMDFIITDAVHFGEDNEILIQVGDRAWLPSEAAGGTDKEKVHYLPGIWDDVFISATGKIKVDKILFLPSLAKKTVTVKTRLLSLYPPQMLYGSTTQDAFKMEFTVREKISGKTVANKTIEGIAPRDKYSFFETKIPLEAPIPWTPDTPFLYTGEVKVYNDNELTDTYSVNFGMRDFTAKGKLFYLNGEKFYLRGTNITLHRFFEDPDCRDLAWNREWVKKLMIDLPKSIDWNAMRICVGLVPDFWYDLCDEYGIVLQNEWLYWQLHGWDIQVRKEYANWVWSDGNHPSIVIWDAINENKDNYIGNTLIPELKQLDPTRIWDAGYMTANDMRANDEMDEPHPYRDYIKKRAYNLGDLDSWDGFEYIQDAGVPQLANEYGWIWLWRNGSPSKLTVNSYNHFVGENATPEARRELQAYWLQLETEWLRAERSLAGVLAFCHLTNNYGYTGDWFINDIKDLEPSPAFKWFKHCFAPEAVFINLADQRYIKHYPPYTPQSILAFNLIGVNDRKTISTGKIKLRLIDSKGTTVIEQNLSIDIPAYSKKTLPCQMELPGQQDGYLLVTEYYPQENKAPVVSRRYIKVGNDPEATYGFYELKP